jgi:hypothetical protein
MGVFIPSAEDPLFQQARNTQCQVSFAANKSISTASASEATGSSATPFYRCIICGYQSARQYSTKQHLLSVHRGTARFRCAICEHTLHTWRELAVHVWRTHAGQLPLVARQTFKDHARYLRENMAKISGFHHMKCDMSKTSFDSEVRQKVASPDLTRVPPEIAVQPKMQATDLSGGHKGMWLMVIFFLFLLRCMVSVICFLDAMQVFISKLLLCIRLLSDRLHPYQIMSSVLSD